MTKVLTPLWMQDHKPLPGKSDDFSTYCESFDKYSTRRLIAIWGSVYISRREWEMDAPKCVHWQKGFLYKKLLSGREECRLLFLL
jgi:hypothetical protein